ncbi:LPXTG-motif cell wall anchor domain-containing protein/TQXA domain-containing protein [Lentzea fradiae]|uniref:LPXTG-motif cell wall anchor domain-containing protein/TQXA domain-containing protein n=1 Tax=Lentzea fradiae TaxID=200378 RepID=A0A1G8AZV9_9PSEU|nr:thioester domain-containing protein [Lentzea fradiae]SDH25870.1 LPXTG-motif cell wall anchor domain-containing protein/TQXA domain-containing protein [Lentzea fradiae]
MASRLRIGAALLGATAALSLSALPAHAEVKITPDRGGQEQGHDVWLKHGNKSEKQGTSVIKLRIDDEKDRTNVLAYCVELPTPLKDGDVLKEVPWDKHPNKNTKFKGDNPGKVLWVLNRSYPNKSVDEIKKAFDVPKLDKKDVIAATQAALWHFSDDAELEVDNKKNDSDVVDLYKKLISQAQVEAEAPKPTLNIDPASQSGKAGQKIGPFKVTTTATEVKVTANLPEGVTLVDADGSPLAVQKKDELAVQGTGDKVSEFFVNVPEGSKDGKASFKLSAEAEIALGRLFVAHDGKDDGVAQSLVVAQPQKVKVETEAKADWKTEAVPTQPTTTTTTPETTTTAPETTTTTTETTPAAPAPGGGEDLASTGASILWPLVGGLVLVGAGVGALFVVRRKNAGA